MTEDANTLVARFASRRDAELAVEKLVQEYGCDRKQITIHAEGEANSAGPAVKGADADARTGDSAGSAHEGRVVVKARVPADRMDKARTAFSDQAAKPSA